MGGSRIFFIQWHLLASKNNQTFLEQNPGIFGEMSHLHHLNTASSDHQSAFAFKFGVSTILELLHFPSSCNVIITYNPLSRERRKTDSQLESSNSFWFLFLGLFWLFYEHFMIFNKTWTPQNRILKRRHFRWVWRAHVTWWRCSVWLDSGKQRGQLAGQSDIAITHYDRWTFPVLPKEREDWKYLAWRESLDWYTPQMIDCICL